MYCTYFTSYRGNRLPPFYIGYTSVNKIEQGYNGSVSSKKYKKVWKQERVERPHLFRTVVLRTFNTRKDALDHEERLLRSLNVHKNDLYINMSIAGKNFTPGPLSEEVRKKIGEANRKKSQDPDFRRKVSEAAKKRSQNPEYRRKLSESAKERVKRIGMPKGAKGGFRGKTHSAEAIEKMREANRKRKLDPEYRQKKSEASKKAAQGMTPEQRKARSKKIWEARRLK